MAGYIFISYRREDEAGYTQALYQRLEVAFGPEQLFMDTEGKIRPGDDFVGVIETQVAACDVLLAVIGPHWSDGGRLDDPNDFVRIEIASAINQDKRVIPVLVNKAMMPRADDLPVPVKPLARRNAVRLTIERFAADCAGLTKALEVALTEAEGARAAKTKAERQAAEELAQRRAEEAARAAEAERLAQASAREQVRLGLGPEDIRKAEELANWDFIKGRGEPAELRNHLARFPAGVTYRYARAALDEMTWSNLGDGPGIEGFSGYLSEFPDGMHAAEARAHRDKLIVEIEAARQADETKRKETEAWAHASARDLPAIEAFLRMWPDGQHAKAAKARLKNITREKGLPLAVARANKYAVDWKGYRPPKPRLLGPRAFSNYDLAEVVPYIDWTPFFQTWELSGRYPQILNDNKLGPEARKLFTDAQDILKRIVAEKWLTANGVVGFWPANAIGDDIELYTDEDRKTRLAVAHTMRQQMARDPARSRPHTALADFIAPRETGLSDYLGGFAVTAGLGEEEAISRHIPATDDYDRIMLKAVADRLAEALAERLHERVRRELWGYAMNERLSNEELIVEKYTGIRPAPGYPSQPDHTEKATLWRLMDVGKTAGIKLTESYAMWPGASVSGFYFSHPQSHYFGIGKIERDQLEDYAQRKGWTISEAERWLAPILNY